MVWLGRLAVWCKIHVRTMDVITGSLMLAFVIFTTMSIGSDAAFASPGVLFNFNAISTVIWSALLTLPMMVRRSRPQSSALAFVSVVLLQLTFGPAILLADGIGLIMLYCAIVHGDPKHTWGFIALALAVTSLATLTVTFATQIGPLLGTELPSTGYGPCKVDGLLTRSCGGRVLTTVAYGLIVMWSCVLATVVMAFWQRARHYTLLMMDERNAALKSGEKEQRHIAQLAERARIARDMHDVVAHTLSIIIVQSDGGRYAGARNPEVAKHTMLTINHEAERALHDMRQLLGVFGGSAQAHYANIAMLVTQFRQASPHNTLERRITGTARPQRLTGSAETTAYRLVQESLTNIRKYAGTGVRAIINEQWGEHALKLEICDNGRGAASTLDQHTPGLGLIGMRERVHTNGGTLEAGPQITGGFRVCAVLPYAGSTPAAEVSENNPAHPSVPARSVASMNTGRPAPNNLTGPVMGERAQTIPGTRSRKSWRGQNVTGSQQSDGTTSQHAGTVTAGTIHSIASAVNPRVQIAAPTWNGIRAYLTQLLRSKRSWAHHHDTTHKLNVVERLSRWTQDHFLITDCIWVALLILLTWTTDSLTGSIIDFGVDGNMVVDRLNVTIMLLPLCLRRQAPELSAMLFAGWSTLLLLFAATVPVLGMLAIVSVYSAILYGRDSTWRWVGTTVILDAVLLGFYIAGHALGYPTLVAFLPHSAQTFTHGWLFWNFLAPMVFVIVLCFGAMASARWSRSSGANALVLQAREEALRAEQEHQRTLAANMERERVGSSIRSEVTHTLDTVIEATKRGLTMLQRYESMGTAPPPEQVEQAFMTIGTEGRAALAHMRELLGVLHQTVRSDVPQGSQEREMNLKPPASLDELMHTEADEVTQSL